MTAISSSGKRTESVTPARCDSPTDAARPESGAALGPQNNEKRPLTLEDVPRSEAVFDHYRRRLKTLKSDVVIQLKLVRVWPQRDGLNFGSALVVDPGLDQVGSKDPTLKQEVVIALKAV
jgi:hypothetical protein